MCAHLTHKNSRARSLTHSLTDSLSEQVSKEKFKEDEEREWTNTDPNKQNLKAVMEMADVQLRNDGTVEEFHTQIAAMLDGPHFAPPPPIKPPSAVSSPAAPTKSATETESEAEAAPKKSTEAAAVPNEETAAALLSLPEPLEPAAPAPSPAPSPAAPAAAPHPMQRKFQLVGITGTLGAGKGEVVAYLKEKFGFAVIVQKMLADAQVLPPLTHSPASSLCLSDGVCARAGGGQTLHH